MMILHLVQVMLDLTVAGISLVVVFGFFAFIAAILCTTAFIHHSKS
ncbi:chaperonin 60 subunit beta [Carex rostrata]